MDRNENTVKESTEDGQVYEHVEEMTEDRQVYENVEQMMEDGHKYEHNRMFEERCGIKCETITVVSLLFINLVIHCHRLSIRNCVFSTLINKGQDNEDGAPSKGDRGKY